MSVRTQIQAKFGKRVGSGNASEQPTSEKTKKYIEESKNKESTNRLSITKGREA